jgi:hypothetical protein
MTTPVHDPNRTPPAQWLFLAAAVLAELVAALCCLPARGAPAPFAKTQSRQTPRPAGNYLLCWGGHQPNYHTTLHADGTHTTVGMYYSFYWSGRPYLGWWRYDRHANALVVVETQDGGVTVLSYAVDLATGKGRTHCGTAVELRRCE